MPVFKNQKHNILWNILVDPKLTITEKEKALQKYSDALKEPILEQKNKNLLFIFFEDLINDFDEVSIRNKIELLLVFGFDVMEKSPAVKYYHFEFSIFYHDKNLKPAMILLKIIKEKNLLLNDYFLFLAVKCSCVTLVEAIFEQFPDYYQRNIYRHTIHTFLSENHKGIRNPEHPFTLLFYAIFYAEHKDKYAAKNLIQFLCEHGGEFSDFLVYVPHTVSHSEIKLTLTEATEQEIKHFQSKENYMLMACEFLLKKVLENKDQEKQKKQIHNILQLLKIINIQWGRTEWKKITELVTSHSVQLWTQDVEMNSLLIYYCCLIYNTKPEGLKALLEDDPKRVNYLGHYQGHEISPLFSAIEQNNIFLIRFLILKGADINYFSPVDKLTPLGWAAQLGHKEILIELLNQGANPLIFDYLAPHFSQAFFNGHRICASILVKAIFSAGTGIFFSMKHSIFMIGAQSFEVSKKEFFLNEFEKINFKDLSLDELEVSKIKLHNLDVHVKTAIEHHKQGAQFSNTDFFIKDETVWVKTFLSKEMLEKENNSVYVVLKENKIVDDMPGIDQIPEEGLVVCANFKEFAEKLDFKLFKKTIKDDKEDPFVDLELFIQSKLIEAGMVKPFVAESFSSDLLPSKKNLYQTSSSNKNKNKNPSLPFFPLPKASKEEKAEISTETWLGIITCDHVQLIRNHHNTESDFMSFIHPSLFKHKKITEEIWKQLYSAATRFARTSEQTGLEPYKGHQQVYIKFNDQSAISKEVAYAVKNSGTAMRFYCCLFWSNLGTPLLFAFDVDEHEKQFSGQTFKLELTENTLKELKEIEPKDALIASRFTK